MPIKTIVFSFLVLGICAAPLLAQETPSSIAGAQVKGAALTPEQKEQIKADRRARREAWIKAHPEQIKQMKENRAKRQQWMKDHPQEALKMKKEMEAKQAERRAKIKAQQQLNPTASQ